jgi:hypothetical protein
MSALVIEAEVDVVAVVGRGEAVGVRRPVRVEAVDELGRIERARESPQLDRKKTARSERAPGADLTVDGPDVGSSPERVVRDVSTGGVVGVV